MSRFRSAHGRLGSLASVALLLLHPPPCHGQAPRNIPEIPPRPADHIHDDASIFSDEEEAELSAKLRQLQEETGFKSFVAAFAFVGVGNFETYAKAILEEWVGNDEEGLLLLFERGGKRLTFTASAALHDYVVISEQQAVFGEAEISKQDWTNPGQTLSPLVEEVSSKLGRRYAEAKLRQESMDWGAFLPFLLPITILGGLLMCLLALVRRPSSAPLSEEISTPLTSDSSPVLSEGSRPPAQRFFPSVEVSERLGARFGGGSPVEVSFPHPREQPPPSLSPDSPQT